MKIIQKILLFYLIIQISNANAQWVRQNSKTNNMLLAIEFVNSNIGYSCGGKATIVKTVNGGYSWQVCHSDSINGKPLYSIASANTDTIVALGDQVIYYSHNTGLDWKKVSLNQSLNWRKVKFINGKFYALGQHGTFATSTDFGVTWSLTNITTTDLYDLQVIDSLNWVMCGNSALLLKSKDAGKTWTSQYINTNGKGNLLIGVYFQDLKKGYVVGENGIFQTTSDGGVTWNDVIAFQFSDLMSSVRFSNRLEGFAIGGDIYSNTFRSFYTKDGGRNWLIDSLSKFSSRLYGLGIYEDRFAITDISGSVFLGRPEGVRGQNNLNVNNTPIKSMIHCYPNPNAGYFTLDLPEGFKGIAKNISIYNDMGVLMNNQEIQNEEIDMTGYAPGTYFIGVFHKTTVFYSKVIIIKQT